ncbi:MAG: 3-hydroxybutyryl-CoA dehydrogenase [Flavobacteriaceae bacterium]|nr:3-hydroxybutyryl-CoA dehydrogenase [Flavobacteriaceae bacterium]
MIVGVIGSGTMGSGIAQVAATAGNMVLLHDADPTALKVSADKLSRILDRLIEKGRMDNEEKSRIQNNINYVSELGDLSNSEIVIEAIVENLEIKQNLFRELESKLNDDTIIATNTSSLSVAAIASALKKPERCLGIHFFNPVPLMKLVELIPAIQTDDDFVKKAQHLLNSWGKTIAVAKDTPGFIVNRVARPFYSESLRIYEEGMAEVHEIDESLKQLGGFRMGPFELMDYIGNDINYAVTESVFSAFYYDPRYKPSFTQKKLVEANYLGRKSGKGYYSYDEQSKKIIDKEGTLDEVRGQMILDRILVMLINEAADAVYLNIASVDDIDSAMTNGVNYPKGLLKWADEKGMAWCVNAMDTLYDEYHEGRYRCSTLLRRMLRENKTFY